jgi:hypothetical protein
MRDLMIRGPSLAGARATDESESQEAERQHFAAKGSAFPIGRDGSLETTAADRVGRGANR